MPVLVHHITLKMYGSLWQNKKYTESFSAVFLERDTDMQQIELLDIIVT